jgi:hypothetical protein
MTDNRRLAASGLLFLVVFLWTLALSGCSGNHTARVVPGQFDFYINFNGPWAFMQDPDNPNKLVAIAPYIQGHQSAYVAGTNESPVATGIYELSGPPASSLNPNPQLVVVRDSVDRKTVYDKVSQNAGGVRYMIRLPMPSDMSTYRAGREAVGSAWPVTNPDTTEKQYTTHMTLHYRVADYGGIRFSGTADDKTTLNFTPVIGTTGSLDIGVGPLYDLQETGCHDHGKTAFKTLADLFSVKQFIDFPGPDGHYHQDKCGPCDPQNPQHPPSGTTCAPHLGRTGADCKAAMLFLTVTGT